MSEVDFIKLLLLYLQPMFMMFEKKTVVKKSKKDRKKFKSSLNKRVFNMVVKFVNDYMVVFNKNNEQNESHILDVVPTLFHDKNDQLVFI